MIVFDSPRLTDICRCLPGKTGPLYCDRPIADPGEFQKRFSLPALPYPMQQAVLQIAQDTISPGLMIVEAQMGTGKTEAALAAEQFLQKPGQAAEWYRKRFSQGQPMLRLMVDSAGHQQQWLMGKAEIIIPLAFELAASGRYEKNM